MKARTRHRRPDIRQHVLTAACRLFSEKGFRGTHIREICDEADVNIATVCYYFHGKQKLYEAVAQEACQRLAIPPETLAALTAQMAPQQRLYAVVQSLFERLSGPGEWIARLAARELIEPVLGRPGPVGMGLRKDLVLIESAVKQLLGPSVCLDRVRLTALSVLSQCVFFCAGNSALPVIFPECEQAMLCRQSLAEHVACFAIGGCESERKASANTKRSAKTNRPPARARGGAARLSRSV